MPTKKDAQWWRDHRAKQKADAAKNADLALPMRAPKAISIKSAGSSEPAAQTGRGAGPAPQGQGVPAVKLPPVGHEARDRYREPASGPVHDYPPVELSSQGYEASMAAPRAQHVCDHRACDARIAELENQLAHSIRPRQGEWDDLGGVFE